MIRKPPVRMFTAACVALFPSLVVCSSASGAAGIGRDIAATCASCHPRQTAPDAVIPALGSDATRIARQMREFRAGTRPATVMQQLARGYSDAEIDVAAAYLAAQGPSASAAKATPVR